MKKSLFLLALLTLTTAAAAASPDCGTVVFVNLRTLGYQTKAEFPESPKNVNINVWDAKKPIVVCGVTFTPNGNTLKVKVNDNDVFGYMTTPAREATGFYLSGSTPGLFGQSGLNVTLTMSSLYTTYVAEAMIPREMAPGTTVGIRVDNGKLQPLAWPGKAVDAVKFPKKTKIIDVYVKSKLSTNWERVHIDLLKNEMTVYRKFAFPTK